MIIVRDSHDAIPFKDTNQGNVFIFDGDFYMHTEDDEVSNAVNLETGAIIYFSLDDPVIPCPNAKLYLDIK